MNLDTKQTKYNSLKLGLALGLILPVFGIIIFYESRYSSLSFSQFIYKALHMSISSAVVSLSLLLNGGSFFVFMQFNRMLTARGILLGTFLWAFIGFVLKFVWG